MSASPASTRPSPFLVPFVSCFWSRAGDRNETRVLPDGAIDIIFDLSASSPRESAYLVGTMTRPLPMRASSGSEFIAVRFRPGGAQALVGGSRIEFRDRRLPLLDLWSCASEWLERLSERRSTEERVHLLDELLVARVGTSCLPDARVASAVREIERSEGRTSVEHLSSLVGMSRQHLHRLFDRHVGVGVKFFSRVVRLQALLSRLQTPRSGEPHWPGHEEHHAPSHWASLALDLGFYDQSHLVSDFKDLTGVTPSRVTPNNWHPNVRIGRIG